jgi:nitroreductase
VIEETQAPIKETQAPTFQPDLKTVEWLLTTTRTVRQGLDLERPVDRSVIEDCLDLAIQAPNAESRQNWRWYVITEPHRRRLIADYYRIAWTVRNRDSTGRRHRRWRDAQGVAQRTHASAQWLVDHMHEVPVLVMPCVLGKPVTSQEVQQLETLWETDHFGGYQPRIGLALDSTFYGSIFPAIWSFQLALRSRGLGSAITTLHLPFHEFIAAELGIPVPVTQIALLPVAYTKRPEFRPANRKPARSLTYWDKWGPTRADSSIREAFLAHWKESGAQQPDRETTGNGYERNR